MSGAVRHALKKRGVTSIAGGFGQGKSQLVVLIAQALLNVKASIKAEQEKSKQSDIARVHTIEELLKMEDSDEEMPVDS
jgi:ABC-type enterochelin transport system ATPase subunit